MVSSFPTVTREDKCHVRLWNKFPPKQNKKTPPQAAQIVSYLQIHLRLIKSYKVVCPTLSSKSDPQISVNTYIDHPRTYISNYIATLHFPIYTNCVYCPINPFSTQCQNEDPYMRSSPFPYHPSTRHPQHCCESHFGGSNKLQLEV